MSQLWVSDPKDAVAFVQKPRAGKRLFHQTGWVEICIGVWLDEDVLVTKLGFLPQHEAKKIKDSWIIEFNKQHDPAAPLVYWLMLKYGEDMPATADEVRMMASLKGVL